MGHEELTPDTRETSHLIVPDVLSRTGSMTTPFSTYFEMSKTANDIAHEMNIEDSASWIPGNDSEKN